MPTAARCIFSMKKRDAFLFGVVLALGAIIIMGIMIYLFAQQGFRDPDRYIGIAICAAMGTLGFFIARTQSFLLLAIVAPITLIIALFPIALVGSDGGIERFHYLAIAIVAILFNISALVDARRRRKYLKDGIEPKYHSDLHYWLSRGIILIMLIGFIPLTSFLIKATY